LGLYYCGARREREAYSLCRPGVALYLNRRLRSQVIHDLSTERQIQSTIYLQSTMAAPWSMPTLAATRSMLRVVAGNRRSNYATTRNRTLAVGKRIEEEIREEIDHPRVVPEPAERMVVGIDGAFIKAGHTRGRAKGISLRFSPGASRHSPWCGTWIRMQKGGCKPFSGAAVVGYKKADFSTQARGGWAVLNAGCTNALP
jgi:hypothetical protein